MSSYVTSCALCHVMSRYVVLCHVINPDLSNFNLTSPTGLTVKRHRNFIIPLSARRGGRQLMIPGAINRPPQKVILHLEMKKNEGHGSAWQVR